MEAVIAEVARLKERNVKRSRVLRFKRSRVLIGISLVAFSNGCAESTATEIDPLKRASRHET